MSNSKAPTIGEADNRFKPTVISILKNGQISVSNGCGQWSRYENFQTAINAIGMMLMDKVQAKRELDEEASK